MTLSCYNKSGDNMRLRNVKGATDILNNHNIVVMNPKDYKGKWQTMFDNDNPIHIEIGMGKGDFIINMALTNPHINYIGIEKFDSVLVRAVEKVNIDIPNLRLIRYDATDIENIFEHEIDCIYLNHSDPWPKARHAKRRLTSPIFLDKYKLISRCHVNLIMKTDNADLFDYSVETLNQELYKIEDISYDYHSSDNIMTEYEAKFRKLKQPIYYLKAVYYQT